MAKKFLTGITISTAVGGEYTFPIADGSANQAIITDGNGNLSFGSAIASSAEDAQRLVCEMINASGSTIGSFVPVCCVGIHSDGTPEIAPARSDNPLFMPSIGITQSSVGNNNRTDILLYGKLEGINTTPYATGDTLYVAPTGGWSTTRPTGNNLIQAVFKVGRIQQNNGSGGAFGAGQYEDLPNIGENKVWLGNSSSHPVATSLSTAISSVLGYTPVSGTGTINYVSKFTSSTGLGDSLIYDNGSSVNVGNTNGVRIFNIHSSSGDNHLALLGTAPSVSLSDLPSGASYQAKFGLATSNGQFSTGAIAGDFVISVQAGSTIWAYNSVERMRLNTSGRFLIGTSSTATSSLLVVNGSITQSVASSLLKSDSSGTIVAATAGTDYVVPSALSSYVPTSRTITINGTTFDLSADRSWTITSMVYPSAGIAVSTGTAWGTSITDNSSNWNTAFGWGNHASAGYVPGARTLTINGTTFDLTANRSWTIDSTSASTRAVQKYTADGSSATYTVTGGYTVGLVDVYVNGIKLDNASGSEFTATNGTTVVLVSTPASGDIVEVYKYGSQFIATNALRQTTLFTATAGQNTFTVNYSVGLVDVFYNGSKLDSSEYTASTGTSIVFNTNCVVGDKVEVVAYTYNATGYTGVAYSNTPTTNYLTKWTSSGVIGNSLIYDNGTNVGIGTASPQRPLHIHNPTGNACVAQFTNSDSGSGAEDGLLVGITGAEEGAIILKESKPLWFATADTERMRITSTGNVGIGTTNPLVKFQITQPNGIGLPTLGTSTGGLFIAGDGNQYGLYIGNDGNTGNSWLQAMRNNTATSYNILLNPVGGNVGIGTSSPSFKLDVIGGIRVNEDGAGTKVIQIRSDFAGVDPAINVSTNNALLLQTNNTERMRIAANGNIGVGQLPNADCKFNVRGVDSSSTNISLYSSNSNGQNLFYTRNDGAINTGNAPASPYNLTVATSANIFVDTAGFLYRTTSSLKYKNNVKDYNKGLNEVMQLRPVTYESKSEIEKGVTFAGLIAEEVHDLGLTEFVQYAEDGTPDALSYSNMVSLLVKAIQEQQKQISSQDIEIENLKKLIN
jgi:hypothetical protein